VMTSYVENIRLFICMVLYFSVPYINIYGEYSYGFLFRSEIFFRTTQELEYLFFLSRKAKNFFPEFNIRLYDKNSESDSYFFPPNQGHTSLP
jgi:hypothetical protein